MSAEKRAEIVSQLVPDPQRPPADLIVMRGYIGTSDVAETVRIYHNPTMSVWTDIPENLIVARAEVPPGPTAPWGEDVVWVAHRAMGRLTVESSEPGAHPSAVDQPLIPLPGRPAPDRYCPCCGTERPRPDSPPLGGRHPISPWPPS